MHAVAGARPQIASGVNAKAVEEPCSAVGKNLPAREAAAIGSHAEAPDVAGPSTRCVALVSAT